MAATTDAALAATPAEKKDKKQKRSEAEGVSKSKKDKKDKKRKKEKLVQALDEHLQASAAASAAEDAIADGQDVDNEAASDVEMAGAAKDAGSKPVVRGVLVDFALPLASEKHQKKVYKVVKKGISSLQSSSSLHTQEEKLNNSTHSRQNPSPPPRC